MNIVNCVKYVTVNITQSGMEFNFLKYDLNKIDHLGADYDTCSVMHYGATAFAKVTTCNTAVHYLIQ